MEIKVPCNCGSKYKFDVEPVNGQMPHVVNCPSCGADGTDYANSVIEGALQSGAPSESGAQPRIRLNVRTPSAQPEAAPVAQTYSAPAPETLSLRQDAPKEKSIYLGVLGAAIAGFIGMMAWFYLIKWTGYEIGYAAWGVGFLTGVGARVVGCKGTTALGIFAGTCALLAIIGGQYLAVKSETDKFFDQGMSAGYDQRMAYAKEAIAAQTDAEIKVLLAKEYAEEGEKPGDITITDEEVKGFREIELPLLKEFVNGKPSREEFGKNILQVKNSFSYNLMLLKESVGLFTLLWLFLGVGSAFKIASGQSGD